MISLLAIFGVASLMSACGVDNKLNGAKQEPDPFDTGSTYEPPPVDTTDTGGQDSGGTVTESEVCTDNVFAGHTLPSLEDCDAPSTTAEPSWTLVTKFGDLSVGMTLSSPVFGNINDDNGNGVIDSGDTPDVVVAPYSGGVYAYDGVTGTLLWHTNNSEIEQTEPAIADLDGDGLPEIVVGGYYYSHAYHGSDGSQYWQGSAESGTKEYCGAVNVADMDGDGLPEVVIGRTIISGQTGSKIGEGAYGHGSSYNGEAPDAFAADIDLDGEQEVIVGNAAYDINGTALWSNGGPDGYAAVANFDADPEAEIAVSSQSSVFLYDTDGSTIWSKSASSGGYQGPPVIADLDGDGDPEIAIPTSSGITAYEGDGTVMWTYSSTSGYMFDGASAYDLNGDGAWEILDNGATSLRILDGSTGAVLSTFAHAVQNYACGQAPSVADIDGDGAVEISYGVYSSPGGWGVLEDSADGFSPGLVYWNQHAFNITNINDDMTVPTYPDINWDSYNSFRAGPPIDALFPNKNLTVQLDDVCTMECSAGRITVWWSLGNNGSEDIDDDVTITFWGVTDRGEEELGSTVYGGNKPAGWLANSQQTELDGVPTPLYDVFVTIDGGNSEDGGEIGECDETDNEARLGSPLCL